MTVTPWWTPTSSAPCSAGTPRPSSSPATLVCRVYRRVEAGDHTIVRATPESGDHLADLDMKPLVGLDGHYPPLGSAEAA